MKTALIVLTTTALLLSSPGCKEPAGKAAPPRPSAQKSRPAPGAPAVPLAQTDAKVIEIVSEQFGVEASQINRNTRFQADLKADDLDTVELIMELEDTFGLNIPDDDADKLKTVGQAIDYVRAHRNP